MVRARRGQLHRLASPPDEPARRRPTPAILVAGLLAASAVVAAPRVADAYCRSTSCTGDCPRDDDGCKTTGKPLHWPTMCIGFSLQRDGTEHIELADVRRVVEDAFVAWSDLPCENGTATLAFTPYADVECHRTEFDPEGKNANIVLFQDTRWAYSGVDNTLAKTTVTFNKETGEIYDADIELNHAYNEFTIEDDRVVYDLQSVLTHEIGHFIGLDHTPDYDATMFAAYDEGSISQRQLAADDVDGACAAYAPSRDVKCAPDPRGGFTSRCSGLTQETKTDEEPGGCACAAAKGSGSPRGAGARSLAGASHAALWLLLASGLGARRGRRILRAPCASSLR